MATYKGAEIIVEYLIKERVPYLFGLCGHGIIGFLDAVYDRRDRIKAVSVHHEAVAGLMADAYFRVAHRPVATFTSCGPGSAQLPVAVASAFMDSSAFLAITGNVPTSQFNRGPFQESGRFFQRRFRIPRAGGWGSPPGPLESRRRSQRPRRCWPQRSGR